jgi:polysaccharide biosynthesis/export protein
MNGPVAALVVFSSLLTARSVRRCSALAARSIVAGLATFAVVAVLGPSPVAAQTPAAAPTRAAPPTAPTTTDIQTVPSERSLASPSRIEPVEEDYRIGSQDLLEVQVLGLQDLRRDVRVNARGMIGLPLIGTIRVAGLTAGEAEALIGGLYRKDYLQNPDVSVFVKEYTRQRVTVDGAVVKPGIYQLKGPTTLLQAIALAGGQGALANMSDVVLFRLEEGERRAIKFDAAKISSAEAPDPMLQPDDVIVVNRSPARVAVRDSLFSDILTVMFAPFTGMVKY